MKVVISLVQSKEKIAEAISECADSLFDQSINNVTDIDKLAAKYEKHGIVYVAYFDKKPIGLVAFYCNDIESFQAYLSMIVVKDTYQNSGIGRRLLEELIRFCTEKNFKVIKLEVNTANKKAITFYKHRGFVRSGVASNKSEYYVLAL